MAKWRYFTVKGGAISPAGWRKNTVHVVKSDRYMHSHKVKCGDCSSWNGPKVLRSNDACGKVIWQCNHKLDCQKCATSSFTEKAIKELFLRGTNQVINQKEQFLTIYEKVLSWGLKEPLNKSV